MDMDRVIRWLNEKGGSHVIDVLRKLSGELSAAKEDANIARSDRDDALDQLAKVKGDLRESVAQAAANKAALTAEQEKGKSAMDYRLKLEARISELESATSKLVGQCDSLEAKLESKRQDNATLQGLLDDAERKVIDGKQKIAQIADFVTARK